MQTIDQLNQTFSINDEVWFEEVSPGYPIVRVRNASAEATIALNGAHLTNYCPLNETPVIFTSNAAIYQAGKPIRGGIPVCWPWFNAHPSDDSLPAHGYARIHFWNLEKTESSQDGTRLVFSLAAQNHSKLAVMLEFHIGKDLQLALHTINTGKSRETFSEALHSYFNVSDSRKSLVHGLDGDPYMNTVGQESSHQQIGPVAFPDEVDRIYHSEHQVTIDDPESQRQIVVSKSNSQSTIIWNPGEKKGASLSDLQNDEIFRFVCAESGNVRDQSITLGPGENHILLLRIATQIQ
ncbi:MAG: D-hexose-6-phosphate mutarotase [Verrucomicrobiae bacterium]|nr:D-hexose-6-phosphate mutarotase [Verrucomicrobiae bacterium]NNJ42924.1 D-hexose-6-phosphate mutarotase [Akkermansiaceae bacterium]